MSTRVSTEVDVDDEVEFVTSFDKSEWSEEGEVSMRAWRVRLTRRLHFQVGTDTRLPTVAARSAARACIRLESSSMQPHPVTTWTEVHARLRDASSQEAQFLRKLGERVRCSAWQLGLSSNPGEVEPLYEEEEGEGGAAQGKGAVSIPFVMVEGHTVDRGRNTQVYVATRARPDGGARLGVAVDELVLGGLEDVRVGDEAICIVEADGIHSRGAHVGFPIRADKVLVLPRALRVDWARQAMREAAEGSLLGWLPTELHELIASHV